MRHAQVLFNTDRLRRELIMNLMLFGRLTFFSNAEIGWTVRGRELAVQIKLWKFCGSCYDGGRDAGRFREVNEEERRLQQE